MSRRNIVWAVILCLMLVSVSAVPAIAAEYQQGDTVYDSYVYDNEEPVAIRSPYVYERQITGGQLPGGSFGELSDLYYSKENEKLYIADCKRNSIVVMNESLETEYVLQKFVQDGQQDSLAGCSGVCVRDNVIYVADTSNSRILTFRADDYSFIRSFDKPEITQLGAGYTYQPIRLAVGITGQMYIVAEGINSGFIVLDAEGKFQSFVGAPEVKTDFLDEVWKFFMTKKQREALLKSVPTEYNSILFDSKGFIYATTRSEGVQPIVRLNLQGMDILKYQGETPPSGDVEYQEGSSAFVDVCVRDSGVYFALDAYSGRIFAYNSAGKMLFAFGKNGTQGGTTNSPMAIELIGEDKLLVADAVTGFIHVYTCTEFGKAILKADETMNAGDYDIAKECWQYVLDSCSSYTLAKASLGKLALYEKDYSLAMRYSKEAADKDAYSEAFREYRSNFIFKNYQKILLFIAVVVLCVVLYKKIWLRTKFAEKWVNSKLGQGIAYAKFCSFHPIDGFWRLKREKRGNLLTANVLVVSFFVVYLLNVQFCGYLFMDGQPEEVDAMVSLIAAVILMVCYCVGNWCFTSLMDGKGTMKDIYISMAGSLYPYIASGLLLLGLSHVLSLQEAFLYGTIQTIVMLWVGMLIFFGMIMTHDYMPGKGIKTMILTIVGMALIVFLGLMIYNLVDDMMRFFYSLYREMLYRNL